jgi:hypothetical protein
MSKMKLNDKKTSLHVSIDGDLSAEEVEAIIRDLSFCRAEMEPEVTSRRPSEWADNEWPSKLMGQEDPLIMIQPSGEGRVMMSIRTAGLGWLFFALPAETVEALTECFTGKY